MLSSDVEGRMGLEIWSVPTAPCVGSHWGCPAVVSHRLTAVAAPTPVGERSEHLRLSRCVPLYTGRSQRPDGTKEAIPPARSFLYFRTPIA